MVAVMKVSVDDPYVVENELYRCVIDRNESTISITTDAGPDAARRIAEFEADRSGIGISLIFLVEGEKDSRTYLYRLRSLGCLADDGSGPVGEDPYKDLAQKKVVQGVGCPHSRKGDATKCSLCIAAKEKADLVALIKAGKL